MEDAEWHQMEDLDLDNISMPVSSDKNIMAVVSIEKNMKIEWEEA